MYDGAGEMKEGARTRVCSKQGGGRHGEAAMAVAWAVDDCACGLASAPALVLLRRRSVPAQTCADS